MERAVLTDNGEHFTHSEREEQWVRFQLWEPHRRPRLSGWRGCGLKLLMIGKFTWLIEVNA